MEGEFKMARGRPATVSATEKTSKEKLITVSTVIPQSLHRQMKSILASKGHTITQFLFSTIENMVTEHQTDKKDTQSDE